MAKFEWETERDQVSSDEEIELLILQKNNRKRRDEKAKKR